MQDPKSSGGRKKTTGEGTQLQVRVHDDLLEPLDEWIVSQGEIGLTRPEGIRRLLRRALAQGSAVEGRKGRN